MSDTLTDQLVAYFRRHPHQRISGKWLAQRFGYGGFRTRISEARRWHAMQIEPIVWNEKRGRAVIRQSAYVYTPTRKVHTRSEAA